MMAESGVMDVGWMEKQGNERIQSDELVADFVPEAEQDIDRWIDIAYDENGDEIANDDAELLQAQEAIRMEFTSIPAAQPDTNPHRRILKRELQAEALTDRQRSYFATVQSDFFDGLQ